MSRGKSKDVVGQVRLRHASATSGDLRGFCALRFFLERSHFVAPTSLPKPAKGTTMDHFEHERLDVYKAVLDFLNLADEVVEHLPRGRGNLSDQLQRASTSILLNLAEGAGEF